jgi:hypothetical protein
VEEPPKEPCPARPDASVSDRGGEEIQVAKAERRAAWALPDASVRQGAWALARQEPPRDERQRPPDAYLLALRAHSPDQQEKEDAWVAAQPEFPGLRVRHFRAWERWLAQVDAQYRVPRPGERPASLEQVVARHLEKQDAPAPDQSQRVRASGAARLPQVAQPRQAQEEQLEREQAQVQRPPVLEAQQAARAARLT